MCTKYTYIDKFYIIAVNMLNFIQYTIRTSLNNV